MKEHIVDSSIKGMPNMEEMPFLLTNRHGGYAMFADKQISRFFGLHFNLNFKMFKVLSDIRVNGAGKINKLNVKPWCVERTRKGGGGLKETFFMPHGHSALVYGLSSPRLIEFVFDIRESYDNRNFGRNFSMVREANKVIISYTKSTDYREDATNGQKEYAVYACVAFPNDEVRCQMNKQWYPHEYDMDKKRNSAPWGKYLYDAFSAKTGLCVVTFSDSRKKAIFEADYVLSNIDWLKKKQADIATLNLSHGKRIMHDNNLKAFAFSINALHGLTNIIDDATGIYAGLPWFFQFWSRDEAISLQPLFLFNGEHLAKDIVMRNLDMVNTYGVSYGMYPRNDIASSDALGWLCKRIHQNLDVFDDEEREIIFQKLKGYTNRLIKMETVDGLAKNDAKTTWMDTDFAGDNRAGERIEIQAMRLMMYKLLKELSVNKFYSKQYEELEDGLRKRVRDSFWNGRYLKDGANDETIRPNVFIAYYIYPELLEKAEWKLCFDNAINALWLDWGGLASIDKKHPLFIDTYTGENPRSYHRGDSWYWINNLAALCMYRLDKEKYAMRIKAIIDASTREILYSGVIGYHAELSSAKEQKSQGCLAQAWSSAMYVELMHELF